ARAQVVAHDLAAAERGDVHETLVRRELDAVRARELRAGNRADLASGAPFVDLAVDLAGNNFREAFRIGRIVHALRPDDAALAHNRDHVRPEAFGQRYAADPRDLRFRAAHVELERLDRLDRAVTRRVQSIDAGLALADREAMRIEGFEIEAGARREHRLVVAQRRRVAREEVAHRSRLHVDQVQAARADRAAEGCEA